MKKTGSFGGKMAAPFGKAPAAAKSNSSGPPKKAGGQGTGHLKPASVANFSKKPVAPKNTVKGGRSGR